MFAMHIFITKARCTVLLVSSKAVYELGLWFNILALRGAPKSSSTLICSGEKNYSRGFDYGVSNPKKSGQSQILGFQPTVSLSKNFMDQEKISYNV